MSEVASELSNLTEDERREYESDMDSLHILPLNIIPFDLSGLKRAKMIKNARLETVIEMFRDNSAGSGQIRVEEASEVFSVPGEGPHPDIIKLQRLANLNSFDVYTLRVELRKIGVPVNDFTELKLSKSKNVELTEYMREFTRPLVSQIYSKSEVEITDVNQMINLFKDPDHGKAIENLKIFASSLNVEVSEIPKFLEDYGDIFLSLVYFKNCLEPIGPRIEEFIKSMEELRNNFQLKSDKNLVQTSILVEKILSNVSASISNRLNSFQHDSNEMWNNIDAETFNRVKRVIASHHSSIGGVLCGLAVKMSLWNERFGNGKGGPLAQADFVLSEMRHGIEKIAEVEASAPKVSDR